MIRILQGSQRNDRNPGSPIMGSPGRRCYAVGDVHGRLDLLEDLFGQIESSERGLPQSETFVVLLGDLIDRGPDSRGVIDFLLARVGQTPTIVALAGNHEEMLLASLSGDRSALQRWLANGGDACVRSYELHPTHLMSLDGPALIHTLESAIPRTHRDFFRKCHDSVRFGDYFLVHAGIRPGVALDEQRPADLRWIRSEFLESRKEHGAVVIHGHSNLEEVDVQPNRIGLDTSAYRTGILTAVMIEGAARQFLQTGGRTAETDSATDQPQVD
jgi:serine/threonine protein phosphatase 1